MGPEAELLWPGAALLLLLLGAMAMAGLCVHCSRPGPKRTEKIYEQRNLQERQQSFSVASRTYSYEDDTNSYENVLVCQPWSTSAESAAHLSPAGSPDEDSGEPDYVNGDVAREA
ncbi:Linker for activation of T-cells family member 2 [Fukomys damarensis]|uniref:Linker for activation of T-cells family member 2 n=1 Tax=Fukomys damarensis TaxID=885580 RepID=A0A091EJ12_FUKDA|nr:Linker for activation of T-cells family member 2 [Fukomys damarensis]